MPWLRQLKEWEQAGAAVRGVWVELGASVEEEEKDVHKWMRGRLDKWMTVSEEDNTCDC